VTGTAMARITYLDYYVPPTERSVAEILAEASRDRFGWDAPTLRRTVDQVSSSSGCRSVFCAEDADVIAVLEGLLDRFFARTAIRPAQVVGLFFGNVHTFQVGGVDVPYHLQRRYGLTRAPVISVNQQCAGALYSLALSGGLFSSAEADEYVLVLTTCFIGTAADRFLGDCLAGDAAGILVIGNRAPGCRIGPYLLRALPGSGAEGPGPGSGGVELVRTIGQMINAIVARHGTTTPAVARYVLQNMNVHVFRRLLARQLHVDVSAVFADNDARGGHLGDVDVIRNLKDLLDQDGLAPGSDVVLFAVGAFGTTDPDRALAGVLVTCDGPVGPARGRDGIGYRDERRWTG